MRTLGIPFIRSRGFDRWFDLVEGMIWAQSYIGLLLSAGMNLLEKEERVAWENELKAIDQILKVLPKTEHGEARKFADSLPVAPGHACHQ